MFTGSKKKKKLLIIDIKTSPWLYNIIILLYTSSYNYHHDPYLMQSSRPSFALTPSPPLRPLCSQCCIFCTNCMRNSSVPASSGFWFLTGLIGQKYCNFRLGSNLIRFFGTVPQRTSRWLPLWRCGPVLFGLTHRSWANCADTPYFRSKKAEVTPKSTASALPSAVPTVPPSTLWTLNTTNTFHCFRDDS